jgi:hypothetical protein
MIEIPLLFSIYLFLLHYLFVYLFRLQYLFVSASSVFICFCLNPMPPYYSHLIPGSDVLLYSLLILRHTRDGLVMVLMTIMTSRRTKTKLLTWNHLAHARAHGGIAITFSHIPYPPPLHIEFPFPQT